MNLPQKTDLRNIPELPGSYVLILSNPCQRSISIGRLGSVVFPTGDYAYVGSAMGGLSRRVRHYLKPIQRPHWHIDALVPLFRLTELWLFPATERQECRIARHLNGASGVRSVEGFGSTDCSCPSHLFDITNSEKAPLFEKIRGALSCPEALKIRYS